MIRLHPKRAASPVPPPPAQNSNDLCFTCSNDRAPTEAASIVLELQGFVNSAEERKTMLQVICQLLRVQWESVAEVMTLDDGSIPFCATCFKEITEIILLREKLFQIETDIRTKLKKMEDSLTVTWIESGHVLEGMDSFYTDSARLDNGRMTFQGQVMQEVSNKDLIDQKMAELREISNTFPVQVQPSMVQLHLQKNIFEITEEKQSYPKMELIGEAIQVNIDKIDLDYTPSSVVQDGIRLAALSSLIEVDSDIEDVTPTKISKTDDEPSTLNSNAIPPIASANSDTSPSTPKRSRRNPYNVVPPKMIMVKPNNLSNSGRPGTNSPIVSGPAISRTDDRPSTLNSNAIQPMASAKSDTSPSTPKRSRRNPYNVVTPKMIAVEPNNLPNSSRPGTNSPIVSGPVKPADKRTSFVPYIAESSPSQGDTLIISSNDVISITDAINSGQFSRRMGILSNIKEQQEKSIEVIYL